MGDSSQEFDAFTDEEYEKEERLLRAAFGDTSYSEFECSGNGSSTESEYETAGRKRKASTTKRSAKRSRVDSVDSSNGSLNDHSNNAFNSPINLLAVGPSAQITVERVDKSQPIMTKHELGIYFFTRSVFNEQFKF